MAPGGCAACVLTDRFIAKAFAGITLKEYLENEGGFLYHR